jgi:hypothetical protein
LKYLDKTFSVAMGGRNPYEDAPSLFKQGRGQVKKIDPDHKFEPAGLGLCRGCALDRQGHQAKYEANKER